MTFEEIFTNNTLKLHNKMCKYEMDPTSIFVDTDRTGFCPQMDKWTDGWVDGQTRLNLYTPFNFVEVGGKISVIVHGDW